MKWLVRRRRRKEKRNIKKLPVLDRGRALFKFNYPQYEYGVGSYGLPEVRDWGEGATLNIGNYCSIADGVRILLGGHHRADWITTFPFPAFLPQASSIAGYNGTHGDVLIGSDVWLCSHCIILSGVKVGHGAVVAAGSVVVKDVEPYSIVGGNPAKFIRWRFPEEDRLFLLNLKWWNWPVAEVAAVSPILCTNNLSDLKEYLKCRG
ncbi:MAG: CatB-related O-acetyltransferase [Halopseudomonas sabulinigri]